MLFLVWALTNKAAGNIPVGVLAQAFALVSGMVRSPGICALTL